MAELRRMAFEGFSKDFFKFFRDLAKHNERDWFEANKGALSRSRAGAEVGFHRGAGAEAGENLTALPRRSEAERRLDVPHPSRRALLQGQVAVQDARGGALPA